LVIPSIIANFAENIDYLLMIRILLIICMTIFFLSPIEVKASTPGYMAGVMEISVDNEPVISYTEGILTVTGAEGQTMEVVSLTGKKVMSLTIESPAQKIELNIPKGCYIVKVGKVVRKVSIR